MRTLSASLIPAIFIVACMTGGHARAAESVEEVFDKVHTSVVTLYTQGETGLRDEKGEVQTEGGLGSGVLLDGGRIMTAAHVVHSADKVIVEYLDGTRAPARVIGSVVQGDVALLQIDHAPPAVVRPAEIANSDDVRVGSMCFVIGAPLGLSHTLTVGHISARRFKDYPGQDLRDIEYFQTDASINQGNSGGPMFDMQGRVIGIVSFIKTTSQGSQGLGFAVTSNTARRHLLDRNPIWLGMTEVFLTGRLAQAFQLPEGNSGFLLQRVTKGSPADRLGLIGGSIPATIGDEPLLLGGDILLEAMGTRLNSPEAGLTLLSSLSDLSAKSRVSVAVLRAGEVVRLEAIAGDLAPWLAEGKAGR